MPKYAISLLHHTGATSEGTGITRREERNFANLGEALQRGRTLYKSHESSAIGFQISDAFGNPIHQWRQG